MNDITEISKMKIGITDEIMSNMTTKDFVGKWVEYLCHQIKYAAIKCHQKVGNVDAGDMEIVKMFYKDANNEIKYIVPLLEDRLNENICGIEDIFIAVYGSTSDEVYLLRQFTKDFERMDEWDPDYMWDDCKHNERLAKIIGG